MDTHSRAVRRWKRPAIALAAAVLLAGVALAASLRGSPDSMREQHSVAVQHALDFYGTADEIQEAVRRGDLMSLTGDENYEVADFVRHPYAQPEAVLFVERLAAQYREACGERLVVTSATRAIDEQPWNAHALSVHPAGMAVDFRVSQNVDCREFMERAILSLEARGVLNGIREFHPPHYHVAVYPLPYAAYSAERIVEEEAEAERLRALVEARQEEVREQQAEGMRTRSVMIALRSTPLPPVRVVIEAARAAWEIRVTRPGTA